MKTLTEAMREEHPELFGRVVEKCRRESRLTHDELWHEMREPPLTFRKRAEVALATRYERLNGVVLIDRRGR
jgi:hypothetical protein